MPVRIHVDLPFMIYAGCVPSCRCRGFDTIAKIRSLKATPATTRKGRGHLAAVSGTRRVPQRWIQCVGFPHGPARPRRLGPRYHPGVGGERRRVLAVLVISSGRCPHPPIASPQMWSRIRLWGFATGNYLYPGSHPVQPGHCDSRITLQKLLRWKCGSLSARTSALTVPNVVFGLYFIPS
jgi:hypothetical protein